MRRSLLSFLLLAAFGAGSATAQPLEFQKVREIATGQAFSGPYSIVTADFDGDGRPDIAVGDYDSGAVVVLLGNGDGAFRPGVRIPLAGSVRYLAVADLDRDGRPDLIAACYSPGSQGAAVYEVAVLMGLGDGTFREPARIRVPTQAAAILAMDLDGDGIPDLAVGQEGAILLLPGKGDGTFGAPVEVRAPYREYPAGAIVTAILAADFNADGTPDLVAVHRATGSLSLLVSKPGGGYQGSVLTTETGYAHGLAAADFDRDGKPDLAVAGDSGVSILAGNGDGTFRKAGVVEEPARPLTVAAMDLNADGIPDLIVGNYYAGKISILLGNGDGTFREMPSVAAKGDTFAIAVVDLNGDGMPDFVAANHSSQSVTVAMAQGEGRFQRPCTLASSQVAVAAADLDRDGKADLVVVNKLADTVDVLRGAAMPAAGYVVETDPAAVFVADWNGDGIPDLVVPGGRRGDGGSWLDYATVLVGGEDGRFRQGGTLTQGRIVAVADFDGDGRADQAVITPDGQLQILLHKADDTFEPAGEIEAVGTYGPVMVADFNRDGVPDLVGQSQYDVLVFLGKGGGRFQPATRYPLAGQGPRAPFLLADFDGNGIPDLALPGETSICLLMGTGDGSFKPGPCATTAEPPFCNCVFAAGDFDGDGKTDLAVAELTMSYTASGSFHSTLWIHSGIGDGTFRAPVKVYSTPDGLGITSLLAADFEGDGQLRLAAGLRDALGIQTLAILARRPPATP